jgi:hypothetical protein
MPMSRAHVIRPLAEGLADESAGKTRTYNSAEIAEDVGIATRGLAKLAREAGLTTIGYLLESVALEAGAEAAARHWPADIAER